MGERTHPRLHACAHQRAPRAGDAEAMWRDGIETVVVVVAEAKCYKIVYINGAAFFVPHHYRTTTPGRFSSKTMSEFFFSSEDHVESSLA